MFGDSLLVSPVVVQGATSQSIYLPEGDWYDYFRGVKIAGGRTIDYKVDANSWLDIPVFVREGAIIASQPEEDYVDQVPLKEVTLDLFPGRREGSFVYYDDDGNTYAYETGAYFRQQVDLSAVGGVTTINVEGRTGKLETALKTYVLRVHGLRVSNVKGNVDVMKAKSEKEFAASKEPRWLEGKDQFGAVTEIRVPAGRELSLSLR